MITENFKLEKKPTCNDMRSIAGRKICILGYGIENQALVDFLIKKKVKAEITICDARKEAKLPTRLAEVKDEAQVGSLASKGAKWRLGKNYDKNLGQFDIIFRIAGYPLFNLTPSPSPSQGEGGKISSPTKLFFDLCPSKNIIAVTGTKGKGTTSSLIYQILKAGGKKVYLGGNIGIPMFGFMDKINPDDWVVLELSSFQLEDLHKSPQIAVITNFSPEHLASADPVNPNYHKTMKDYWRAKSNIFKYQKKGDYLVLNKRFKGNTSAKLSTGNSKVKSSVKYFTKSELPSQLVGEYNKENIAAAVEAVKIIGIKERDIQEAVKKFKGLPHRTEFVRNYKGIKYYDNSFATTPEATILDLESFSGPIILFLGGADKGADFKKLAREVKSPSASSLQKGGQAGQGKVKYVVLLDGKATPRIKKELLKIEYPKEQMRLVKSMKQAVRLAKNKAIPGDIVLLSTACASFGMFKNYKERGDQFQKAAKKV